MRRIAAALALASTVAAVACEFVNDASDLVGGAADGSVASSADAAVEGSADGGSPDATRDVAQIDVFASDAGTDADACSSFCNCLAAPKPAFCDDFDEDGGLGNWDAQYGNSTDVGTMSVSDAEAYSAPNSAIAFASRPTEGGAGDSVYILHRFTTPFTTATFDVEVYIPALTQSGNQIAGFQYDNGYSLGIIVSDGLIAVFEELPDAAVNTVSFSSGAPPVGAWFPVHLVLVSPMGADGGSFVLRVQLDDGGTANYTYPIEAGLAGGAPSIEVGADYIQDVPPSGWSGYFDNVTLELQ